MGVVELCVVSMLMTACMGRAVHQPRSSRIALRRAARLLTAAGASSVILVHGGCHAGSLAAAVAASSGVANSCEGYWPPARACVPLGNAMPSGEPTEDNGLCPQWRIDPTWAERTSFLAKLLAIEETAMRAERKFGRVQLQDLTDKGLSGSPWVNVFRFRGLAPSRIEAGTMLGNAEFVDVHGKCVACWPDKYADHYIDHYKVVPSKSFQDYVRDFDLEAFRRAVTRASESMAREGPDPQQPVPEPDSGAGKVPEAGKPSPMKSIAQTVALGVAIMLLATFLK